MKISADYIYTQAALLANHLLELDENGEQIALRPLQDTDNEVVHYEGILISGMVNAHCHLELSALKGKIPEKTGMVGFVSKVTPIRRQITENEHLDAIERELQAAFESGTQMMGDICNEASTIAAKTKFSQMFFHNFSEVFGLRENMAADIWAKGETLAQTFLQAGLAASTTLHAPYSASISLKQEATNPYVEGEKSLVLQSLHFLESKAEREIFAHGTGEFLDFYKMIGIDFQGFSKNSPSEYLLSYLQKEQPFLLVHNTEITEEEIEKIVEKYPNVYFCLCPRSNEFIHETFPNIPLFLKYQDKICLGTDSLASNHSLEMLEEIKAIQARYPETDLHILLKWLTTNGANALQQQAKLGKRGGLIQIKNVNLQAMKLLPESVAIRIL
jgi:cytosine/adenosine deaminase-related metal-dependent hydrolase